MTKTVLAQPPVVREGPRITFSVRKAPYPRPLQSGHTSSRQQPRRVAIPEKLTPHHTITAPNNFKESNAVDIDTEHEQPSSSVKPAPEVIDAQTGNQAKRKPKPKRPGKTPCICLLAPLFRTTMPIVTLPKQSTLISSLSTSRGPKTRQLRSTAKSNPKSALKSASKYKTKPDALPHQRTAQTSTTIPSNQVNVDAEKIEQWYITNKAHLEPASRRLVVLTKPTTVRQKAQLKAMRKHHWECELEAEGHLKRNRPTTFCLKIPRNRIDWERLAPYITLMIQAVRYTKLLLRDPHCLLYDRS